MINVFKQDQDYLAIFTYCSIILYNVPNIQGILIFAFRLEENFQQIARKYDNAVQSKAEVEDQLRKQKAAFIALQNTAKDILSISGASVLIISSVQVDASKLGEDVMAKDLAAAHELSSERLAQANRLQALVRRCLSLMFLVINISLVWKSTFSF